MNLINRIKPVPQKLVQKNGNVVLGTLGTAGFRIVAKDLDGALSYFAFDMLCDKLSKTRKNTGCLIMPSSLRI